MSDAGETPRSKPGAVIIGFLVLLVGEVIILANAGITVPKILPEPVSTYAHNVDRLFYVILAIVAFFFLLTEGLLVYFMVKYRAREGGRAVHSHGHHALELAWTFIPGLILFCLAVFQTGTWGMIKFKSGFPDESDPNVEVVQVFGKQFEWRFRYRGPDGKFGTEDDAVKVAEMHVPVNRPVVVQLQTRDVLHSFWLPNARLKQDLMPGYTIRQWFEITKTGRYPIICAELCGSLHTTMKGTLVVETEEEYQAWLKKQGELSFPHIPEQDDIWKFWRQDQ
ncbi:MAG: cytochrome c oxidase subunit II [Planctomycetota bacterium]|jgi:cytochrome c oxidase subunit 2